MSFDDLGDPFDDAEIVSEGPTSTVIRIEPELPDGPRFVAVKTSTTAHAKEPHDIVKEVRLLAVLAHPNIIPLIKQEHSQQSKYLGFWMPYIPYALDALLQSFQFSPHPIITFEDVTTPSPTPREVQFVTLTKSIIFQVLSGVAYLHGDHIQIAHRDIKPSNVLLTPAGRVQLIDFGIAFPVGEDSIKKARDLWPEVATRMYFEVSTGPYRAPELLFGPRTYDAFAIDAWSIGVVFAEFFTSLRLHTDEDEEESVTFHQSDSDSDADAVPRPHTPTAPPSPFVVPRGTRPRPGIPTGRWTRTTLFDGTRGEIGLAWSIFKVRGTPDTDTWPSFSSLPDAGKLTFVHTGPVDLVSLLPNLVPTPSTVHLDTRTHVPAPDKVPCPLDLVHRFLVYEPARRLRPVEALGHPWFIAEPGLVLPTDHPTEHPPTATRAFSLQGHMRTLGDLLQTYVTRKGD